MFGRLLPDRIDNAYGGHRIALWLFGAVVIMKAGIGLGTIFNGRSAALSADGIPIDSFTPDGEQTVVALFAAWGLAQLMLNLIGLVVLARYRAMVPFMFAILLVENVTRKLIFWFLPIPRSGSPPGLYINLALILVMIVGLVLSLRDRGGHRDEAQERR